MKKIVLVLALGFTSVAGFSHGVQERRLPSFRNVFSQAVLMPALMDTNSRALRDFQLRFNKAENARWFSDKDGFVSYFMQNGYGNRAYYDKKGRWQFSLLLYGEDKLPRDIRASVKSTYFDLSVTTVEEVQSIYGMAYVVHLENTSNLKVLRVNSFGEMEILLDLDKE